METNAAQERLMLEAQRILSQTIFSDVAESVAETIDEQCKRRPVSQWFDIEIPRSQTNTSAQWVDGDAPADEQRVHVAVSKATSRKSAQWESERKGRGA